MHNSIFLQARIGVPAFIDINDVRGIVSFEASMRNIFVLTWAALPFSRELSREGTDHSLSRTARAHMPQVTDRLSAACLADFIKLLSVWSGRISRDGTDIQSTGPFPRHHLSSTHKNGLQSRAGHVR